MDTGGRDNGQVRGGIWGSAALQHFQQGGAQLCCDAVPRAASRRHLQRFADHVGWSVDIDPLTVEVYVEYAYLRDVWNQLGTKAESAKRTFILDSLDLNTNSELMAASAADFNRFFGDISGEPTKIHDPSTWNVRRINESVSANAEFVRVCQFKWAFRVKPDLVIQLPGRVALCIEAKWASSESSYPKNQRERQIFNERGLGYSTQRSVQRYMMEELLGMNVDFCFLQRSGFGIGGMTDVLTWKAAFKGLSLDHCPPFIADWIAALP